MRKRSGVGNASWKIRSRNGLFENKLNCDIPGFATDNFTSSFEYSPATLVSGIYYIFLTSKRENDYLNETREIEIERKYNAYNSAYKRRNILLVLYGVIWIYSQYDLLVNGERYLREENRISMYPVLDQQYVPQLTLRIKF